MCLFIVWYPLEFSRIHNWHLWYWNSLLYSLISSGEHSTFAHFAAAIANHYNFTFLVPPGTHNWWVDKGGMIWEACPTPLHMASTGHQSKYQPGSALLYFSDLTGNGYRSAMCYHCDSNSNSNYVLQHTPSPTSPQLNTADTCWRKQTKTQKWNQQQ